MSDPSTARGQFAERLRGAGLSTKRFIDVKDGTKASHNHTQYRADSRHLGGNYGVYAGTGGGEQDGYLVDIDVDDYDDDLDQDALAVVNDLPATFTVESPHTDDDEPGHRYYRVDGDPIAVVRDVRNDPDLENPGMSWGEIRVRNQYVVGPGSQLDGCEKDWCEDCAEPDKGYYRISEDQPIATISEAEFRGLLEADLSDEQATLDDDGDTSAPTDDGKGADPSAVLQANAWIGEYLALGGADDRSTKDFAVCRTLIENGVSESDAHELLNGSPHTKVNERGRKYWRKTWQKARRKADTATDGGVSAASPQGSDGPNTDAENGSAGWVAETKPYAAAVNDDKSPITLKDARSKASEKAMEDYDFITPQAEGEALNKYPLWIYESIDGCYEKRGGAQIAEDLSGGISSFSTSDQNEVANLTKRKTLTSRDRLDAEHEDHLLINVENGVFDVDADEKLPHSAAFNFRHVHPFDYDPDASAEPVLDFLDEVVAEDYEKQTLLEYIGYCFEDGYPLPQFLLLYGTGGNGKGIFFEIVEALLGKPNTSSVALEHMLGDNDYMMAELDGSFVNIDGDIPGSVINTQELNAIKKLTGRDSITVQRKFEHPFELENRAKLMFAANKPPRFHDNTNSVARRLMAIEFPYEFVEDPGPGQKQRRPYRELMAELTADETLSGLFNEAITAYQQVRERGHFTIEEQGSNQERLDEYRRNADPIVAFADRCLENQENMAVPKEILYTIYTRFAEDHGQYPAKKNVLLRKLGRSTDIDVVTGRPTLNVEGGKRRIRICDHLWFKAEALEYLSHELREDVLMATAKLHSTTAPYAEDFLGLSPDADRETGGIVADTKRICRVLNEEGPIHRDELVDAIRERHDMTADRMTEALQRALEQGDAIALQSDHFDAA